MNVLSNITSTITNIGKIPIPQPIKNVIGFIVIYGLVIVMIPYYLLLKAPNEIFLTYFANVDIVSNILSINFPSYFSNIYDINPNNVWKYLSYNIISLIALSGIFIHGLSQKNKGMSDLNIFVTMVIMSVVTWTLPTQLIPYLVELIKEKYNVTSIEDDVFITTIISFAFILLEGLIIHLYLKYYAKQFHNILGKVEFSFE